MSTPPTNIPGPLAGAVVPSAPPAYDQAYMARLVDTINKIIEQLVRPNQVTGAVMVLTDLPHEEPRQYVEGEVYTKMCDNCGTGQVLLAIYQTQGETLPARFRGRGGFKDANVKKGPDIDGSDRDSG